MDFRTGLQLGMEIPDFTLVIYLYPPQTVFVGGYTVFTLSVRPDVRASIRPSVTFCFLNKLKSHGWNLIKPCIHIHIYRANTYNKKIRARGHFYESYFPL